MPLPLPARERLPALADARVVALRQAHDQLVHARLLGRLMTASGSALGLEAGDVLADGAVEQLDVLRQVADVPAERLGRPLIERRPVQAHAAPRRPPHATSARASDDLPDADGPMMPSACRLRAKETPWTTSR